MDSSFGKGNSTPYHPFFSSVSYGGQRSDRGGKRIPTGRGSKELFGLCVCGKLLRD